nr:Mobile element protein [Kibdelosporangium sp. MJ126-NF4]CTQ99095.1 Mobile element protein [Kibdelosporangium sp. MJ126-NF4]
MLFVGDDWAESHHDVELMDGAGRRLAKARLPEGTAGIARLHSMIGEQLGVDAEEPEVVVGIETDRGPWVQALLAAGYAVFAVNPLSVARYRERHGVSGAKSDAADAHTLADMVRTDSHQLRPVAGDSPAAEAIKVVSRAHKTLIWERTRHTQRLRHALRDYFPAALEAFTDLDASDALELLGKAPDPDSAARLSLNQIRAALKRARRRDIDTKATAIQALLRERHLGQPAVVNAAYSPTTRAAVAVLAVLDEQVTALQNEVDAHFGRHPDAEIILSQPGLGVILGARVLAEFGDDRDRYADAKCRKNYAPVRAQRPAHRRPDDPGIQRAQGLTRRTRLLRPAPNPRRRTQRRAAATSQPARRHPPRLPQTRTPYDETTAWSHHAKNAAA